MIFTFKTSFDLNKKELILTRIQITNLNKQ